ncbi:MAG: 23S rRNA (adenine(2503)-C(2))-methyltransferase RlmN [Anaerolineae bacterium]
MTVAQPISLLDLSQAELAARLTAWGAPRYRADQVWEWIYKKLVADPSAMTNLPRELRERLATLGPVNPLVVVAEQRSQDGQTIKWLFRLPDGVTIETVLMLYDERRTVCISTQAGCAMGCVFCATGQAGLARNLTAGEIVAQALAAARWLAATDDGRPSPAAGNRLTNIVVMGMGEPFANYERTWAALRTLTDPEGFGLGARHITVSTVGLPHGIRKMAEEPLQINLAVSLHAANDDLRTQLVPVNHRYPIAEVMAAVRDYIARTRRRVTFEYALMKGINDLPTHARELASLLKGLLCHVNLIPLNPVAGSPYQPSTNEAAAQFRQILEARGIPATLRLRRGLDIDAGCGQLRRRMNG